MRFRQSILCGAALATLTACSGGGDGTVPDIPNLPANVSPVFISATSISIEENTTGTIYTAQATDADSDAITLSVTGGADSGSVSFEASTGALTLNVAPDFERPGDSNGDNVYEVILQASDGRGGVTMISLQIAITDRVDTVELVRVGDGFSQPLGLQALPDGSGRVLVVEKTGRVRLLNPATGAIESVDFLDVSGSVSTNGERGLLGLALSPDFAADGFVYVHLTNTAGDSEVRRFQVFSGTPDQVDPLTQEVILQYAQPETNHNAGWIGFDRNGFLIVPTGDGGGSGDPNNLAQNPQSLLGKVLRLDVSADDFPSDPLRNYAIPAGNTFTDPANGLPEIFAVGLRNPFQSSFDPASGDLLIGDVGQGAIEEVNRLPMDDSSRNFGWALREGTASFKGPDVAALTAPVAEYSHGAGAREGRSITGGVVYRGPVEALQDTYIFGDFISDNVWGVSVADLQNGQTVAASAFSVLTPDFQPSAGSLTSITAFGTDQSDNLYIVSIGGDVFQMRAEP